MKQTYIPRQLESCLRETLERDKSILLLGPRQTGKTTLVNRLTVDISFSLIQPETRQYYERSPSVLAEELETQYELKGRKLLVSIDEVQLVPELMNVTQDLIDRGIAQFILTGSSARRLNRAAHVNLLPGRIVYFKLTPLSLTELPTIPTIEQLLHYGSLPGIISQTTPAQQQIDLQSYVTTYLEQEIRAEAAVRNIAAFSRFLELAASESGNLISMRKLADEVGVAHSTITEYYQILEDCLVVERIEPLLKTKTRRKLSKSSKYVFFDLGIRRISANEGTNLPEKNLGQQFEQLIGLELVRYAQQQIIPCQVYYWRDHNGPEVDWVLQKDNSYYPIEVKWTQSPKLKDARHLQIFLREYENSPRAYIVCRIPRPLKLADNIYAIPWQSLIEIIKD